MANLMTGMEWQVSNYQLSLRLASLGEKQDSVWYWESFINSKTKLVETNLVLCQWGFSSHFKYVSAYTVAELGTKLPESIPYPPFGDKQIEDHDLFIRKIDGKFNLNYHYYCMSGERINEILPDNIEDAKEADARAKMRIYLLEKGLVKL